MLTPKDIELAEAVIQPELWQTTGDFPYTVRQGLRIICGFLESNFLLEEDRVHSEQIIAAHNRTYGLGINPDAVPMMREALEKISKERTSISIPCKDPQCGDSTWDHECTLDWRDEPTNAASIALAALAKTKEGVRL